MSVAVTEKSVVSSGATRASCGSGRGIGTACIARIEVGNAVGLIDDACASVALFTVARSTGQAAIATREIARMESSRTSFPERMQAGDTERRKL